MKKQLLRKGIGIIVLVVGLGLFGCKRPTTLTSYDTKYLDCFDTITSVTMGLEKEGDFQSLQENLHKELIRYHQLFNIYENYEAINNIKTINDNAGIQPVTVDKEIIRLLEFAVDQYEQTDGMVNVAMGSVLSIWHQYRAEGLRSPDTAEIPSWSQLYQAKKDTQLDKLVINKEASTVYLPESNMQLDVGAIAKGYAVDLACEFLGKQGVTSAMLSAGGNVRTIGTRPDGTPWRIAIQNPDTKSDKPYLHVAHLQDMSLVTSGSYQRFYVVDGISYHHIIHPHTLVPKNEYLAVTILSKDSKVADALSTAVFNMPLNKGREFIESLEGVEALWILSDKTEVFSSGFQSYLEP